MADEMIVIESESVKDIPETDEISLIESGGDKDVPETECMTEEKTEDKTLSMSSSTDVIRSTFVMLVKT